MAAQKVHEVLESLMQVERRSGADIARLSGLSPAYISVLRRGGTNPSVNAIRKLATGLARPSYGAEPDPDKFNLYYWELCAAAGYDSAAPATFATLAREPRNQPGQDLPLSSDQILQRLYTQKIAARTMAAIHELKSELDAVSHETVDVKALMPVLNWKLGRASVLMELLAEAIEIPQEIRNALLYGQSPSTVADAERLLEQTTARSTQFRRHIEDPSTLDEFFKAEQAKLDAESPDH